MNNVLKNDPYMELNAMTKFDIDYSGKDCEVMFHAGILIEWEGSDFSTPSGSLNVQRVLVAGYTVASSSGTSRSKGGGRRRPRGDKELSNQTNRLCKYWLARNYAKIARRLNSRGGPKWGLGSIMRIMSWNCQGLGRSQDLTIPISKKYEFADMLKVCEMAEISGVGDAFTWSGKRYQKYIQCKLDRCFANKEWRRVFYQASQEFMEKLGLDHRPVMVNLVNQHEKRRGAFRFDKRMVGKVRVAETIQETWSGAGSMSLMKRIGAVRQSTSSLGSRPTYAWRSILFGWILLEKGLRRDVGSGEDINVWMDKWLFDEVPKAPLRKPVLFNLDLRVCDLICPQTKTWDMEKLQENFFAADIKLILKHKPAMGEKDAYEWVHNRWGAYTVKSGYWLASPRCSYSYLPWVLWMLWKNKNVLSLKVKSMQLRLQWRKLKMMQDNGFSTKLNLGLLGLFEIARVVQLHSGRAFSGIDSLVEAKHLALVWAIESMAFHKINKVFFEVEAPDLVGAITRPRAWPAFRGYGAEILEVLQRLGEWELQSISREENKCAFLMARSVTNEQRLQSYVAQGEPEWLRRVLDEDKARR
ncbi:hypothetical protein Bca52824_088056 [Brassica carinata]|uniref:RNase H type-1 domain-containing protein n=1 Tax=Brassica carinata TaxID=52824 RepID=A0A8X7PCN0_BRACI|nr:hypothetical protein Bca52824_088056 [Brassica carinata]